MKELWTIELADGFERSFKNLRKRHAQSADRALVKIEGTSLQGDTGTRDIYLNHNMQILHIAIGG